MNVLSSRGPTRFGAPLAALAALGALSAAVPSGTSAAAPAGAAAAQHIQHVRGAVLPLVLIRGEHARPTTLSDRMTALHVPGVSIAVIHGGSLEWAQGFGVTRIGGPAVTANTLFQAASISKPVTAFAALSLVQSGKLDLDADVNGYLKTWKIPSNEFTAQHAVTLRELLSHTGGMTVHGFLGYASGSLLPSLDQILDGLPPANSAPVRVDVAPGSVWRYSGGGYLVVERLIEDVTGERFAQFMRHTVLERVGMTHSSFLQPLPPERLADAATPYGGNGAPIQGGPHVYPEMAAAGLWTTPSDLARFAIEIQRSLHGKSNRVLSTSTLQQMLTAGRNNWGLGLHVGGAQRQALFDHGGANAGYRCELVAYDAGDGAVIMTNSDNGGQLAQELLRTIAHEYDWPDYQPKLHNIIKVDASHLDLLVGTYQIEPNFNLTVLRDGDHLVSQATGQGPLELFAESGHEFFPRSVDARLTFETDERGRAIKLVLHQNDQERSAQRLDETLAKPIEEALAALNQRVKSQTPSAGGESALRQMISEISAGTPNYDKMSAHLAAATREQLPQIRALLNGLGELKSATFQEVAPDGSDLYQLRFANGTAQCSLKLEADGVITDAGIFGIER
jgi:CubicO group peptidase (beta-lactamase class C family)